jgi:hypothetical protein
MKYQLTLLALVLTLPLFAQTNYFGTVGGNEIFFSTDAYQFSEEITAVYLLEEDYEPYWMTGLLDFGTLKLSEFIDGEIVAILEIPNFDDQKEMLTGSMTFMGSGETFDLKLDRLYSLSEDDSSWEDGRLDQLWRFDDYYFVLLTSKTEDEYYARVTGIQIFDDNHQIIQEISGIDCSSVRGYNSIQIEDFNFDGALDFSIFQEQYSGANTMSMYYLFNEEDEEFQFSEDLSYLMSAEFNPDRGIVIERNATPETDIIIYYSWDANGNLVQLNMIPDEYLIDEVWDLAITIEGDFDTEQKTGQLVMYSDQTISVTHGDLNFKYRIEYGDEQVTLTNVEMEEDVLHYQVKENIRDRMVWTRLENDVFETWVITK